MNLPTRFETDEEEALRHAFSDSIAKGKLFNVNSWKKGRERQRVLENKLKYFVRASRKIKS